MLGPWTRPAIAAGASAGAFVIMEIKAREIETDLADREARNPVHQAANQLSGLPVLGFLFSFAGSAAEIAVDPQIASDKAVLAILRLGQGIVILAGGALTLYLLWKDVIQTPAQKQEEIRRQAAITQAAVAGALGGTQAAVPEAAVAVPIARESVRSAVVVSAPPSEAVTRDAIPAKGESGPKIPEEISGAVIP